MEQHTARTSIAARRPSAAAAASAAAAPAPPRPGRRIAGAGRGISTAGRRISTAGRRITAAGRRLRALPRPRPRLTGLGTGALTTVVTVLGGAVDSMLFDGPGVLFGLVFVAVSIAAAVYVRPYDLVAAPVAAPIAFAIGITLTADSGSGGLVGRAVGVFTGLALMTGWLYTGTVLAAAIVAVRALRQPSRRRRSPRCSATAQGRSPR